MTYLNDKYGFSGQVPNDWKIYAEIKDDPSRKSAIIDWGRQHHSHQHVA